MDNFAARREVLDEVFVDNFNATTRKSFFNSGGNISADNFNVTAGNVFLNDFATIDVDNFNVTAVD